MTLWSNREYFIRPPFVLYTSSVLLVRQIVSQLLGIGDLSEL